LDTNTINGLEIKNFTIPEDLAKVNHIFCDKTGTLTQNDMIFRGLGIQDKQFLVDPISVNPL